MVLKYIALRIKEAWNRERENTNRTIENVIHVLACESDVLKGGKTRLVLAESGYVGVQPIMKDSIRKPVVFPDYVYN